MDKLTNWEKKLIANGEEIFTWEHDDIVDYLLQIFHRDKDDLLLKAAIDTTKRHSLVFTLDYPDCFGIGKTNFGGQVIYDKKKRRFTHIQYSDRRNWSVMFSIESRAAFFAHDFFKQIKHAFPLFYSNKKLTEYLLKN